MSQLDRACWLDLERRDMMRRLILMASLPLLWTAAPTAAAAHLDADLIRICAEHIVNLTANNTHGGIIDPEDNPLWTAYMATHDAINAARPQTLDGILEGAGREGGR